MEFLCAVIVGSGSSSSTPSLSCLASDRPCKTCLEAHRDPCSVNNRNNPSLLIQLRHPADGSVHNILIDCGKTFRGAALKVFPRFGVSDLSGLLLTHEHADACFGLDDLREFTRKDDAAGELPVYADRATLLSSYRAFRYLFPAVKEAGRSEHELTDAITRGPRAGSGWGFRQTGATWTASLRWHLMQPMARTRLDIRGRRSPDTDGPTREAGQAVKAAPVSAPWWFVAVPVLHGADYYSEAFLFRIDNGAGESGPRLFFYCSDVSCVDAAFHDRLRTAKQLLLLPEDPAEASLEEREAAAATPLDVLVLDLLSWNSYYSTHLSAKASLAAAKELGAKHTFFVGMSHTVNHSEMTAELAKRGLESRMSAAYDGCVAAGCQPSPSRSFAQPTG